MSKLIHRWLTDALLREEYQGRFIGTIADVTMEPVYNKFRAEKVEHVDPKTGEVTTTYVKQVEPVIRFAEDDVLLIPNQRMRRELVAMLGKESDSWKGSRVCVRRQAIEYDNDKGVRKVRFEKRIEAVDAISASAWERGQPFRDYDTAERDDTGEAISEPAPEPPTAEEIFGRRRAH